ncbi:ABC transporter substrate-binding protein [Saccharospirillum salsuginis]|uniref:ABC transporter substrate-binding protein n=1 Tax=Saccharospirillum salsuginis TaxID=418750 RepID=A0A918NJU3_9GAMM|nr:ABC transporter substrate-binding protein [Saccharospirillum salsuginis]GGX72987.1 ABC transporter substrate-binding protein [Saccharospirillum salsuginis]
MRHILWLTLLIPTLALGGQSRDLVLVPSHTNGFERNFNPFDSAIGSFYAQDFIYEPLWVFNVWHPDRHYPRLAKAVHQSEGLTRLTYTLRSGVYWSDGTPFTAEDVVFTVDYARRHPDYPINLDIHDPETGTGLVKSARVVDNLTVEFELARANALAHQHIGRLYPLPRHIFSRIDDPVAFANTHPVGTGPFTEVDRFNTSYFKVCRNPHYYEADRPAVDCLKYPHYSGNESLWAAARRGMIDWMGEGVRDPVGAFGEHTPHNRYWMAPGSNTNLQLNTTRPPLDDVAVRKAISLAIDRETLLTEDTFGLTSASPYPVGTGPLYQSWYDETALAPFRYLMQQDVEAARALLDGAGYLDRDGDGYREQPDGTPIQLGLAVPSGWTDWVNSLFTVAANLRSIGLNARVESMDEQAWYERIPTGNYDIYIMWTNPGLSPWRTYSDLFNPDKMKPGNLDSQAMHMYRDKDIEDWLHDFALMTDDAERQRIMTRIQTRVAETLPVITLFANPSWYQYNDERFTGWVTESDPFVRPMVHRGVPERLIHVLNLRPR